LATAAQLCAPLGGEVFVIVTVRSDFLGALQDCPEVSA
jgi:hypothetical protein